MMSLLDKLLPARKNYKSGATEILPCFRTAENDRRSPLSLGTDQVRILLFRECEWRGRKLLYDSVTVEKNRCKIKSSARDVLKNNAERKNERNNVAEVRDFEKERTAEDDVSLLSEMAFGTVAMTYRGSSFKVHSMNSPPCIMCTKIFPATEHSSCKQSERVSDEGLGRSVNLDSNASMRTLFSRPSSGNLSGNDLNPGPRKSSTCSSTESGWDIDIPPPMGSSQSLESNGSSGIGSLSSLRRRWLRAVSTSLCRCDSDDTFGMHWNENGESRDGHKIRHKTRLGLTMIVQLTEGQESKIETRLLEHMALLEGMLDRLRYCCSEKGNLNGGCKGMQLTERMYTASSRFIILLLRLLMDVGSSSLKTPLLWHDVLLNSVITVEEKTHTLYRGLQQMCQLLDDVDTKSTNFFLSTVVTAVLTYHLGWVCSILPAQDRHTMEKLGLWYPCNPLWAQLGDLYGALGNPVKVAHTVIAGDPRKTDLINSILSFLSYFIRSGIVQRRQECRYSVQQDVEDATELVEQARLKRPYLFDRSKQPTSSATSETSVSRRESSRARKQIPVQIRSSETTGSDEVQRCSQYPVERPRMERSVSPLKRSGTMKANLDDYMSKQLETTVEPEANAKNTMKVPYDRRQDEKNVPINSYKTSTSSKVKIIVSAIGQDSSDSTKDSQYTQFRNIDRLDEADDMFAKMDALQRGPETSVDTLKLYSSRPDFQSVSEESKESQVFFTLGGEEKSTKALPRSRLRYNCQCSCTFTGVPSTSAQLPEGVLRKIIQRNFPESKSMQHHAGAPSVESGSIGFCLKCNGQGYAASQSQESTKQILETPTNATEVLRTCGSSSVGKKSVRISRSNSLEALMEANSVVELPMPRTKKITPEKLDSNRETGFAKTLLQTKISEDIDGTDLLNSGYTWGLVVQGLTKKRRKRRKRRKEQDADANGACENEVEKEWWYYMREEVLAGARFPTIDQPVAEALCILADLDTWHVGIISNNTPSQSSPLPVGMSRLVANMLEAFAYVWRKYHSPAHCIGILEAKLREMWLRSEALAEMLMAAEVCDANVATLTNALDLDAADIPLLLAVATTHSPEIAQRFGLTLT